MLFFMFLSIFLLAIAAKLHISRQRYCFFRTYASAKRIFLIKSHNLPLFALFFRFFLQLSLEPTTGLCPIYSEANYHLQLALRAIYYPPATPSLSTTVDIRLIYGTYTVDTRYISIGIP